ncbi:MAG: hypothetical protein ACSHX8_10690 [Opitutaceae bacterium]
MPYSIFQISKLSRDGLRRLLIPLWSLGCLANTSVAMEVAQNPVATEIENQSLNQLEERLAKIDSKLSSLAQLSLRTGEGTIGYRSNSHSNAGVTEWIEVDFEQAYQIDQIVLVPVTLRDHQKGHVSDAFPQKFRILAGVEGDSAGSVIAEYDATNRHTTDVGIAPVIIAIEPTLASWVRLEVSQLSKRAFDGRYVLELSELLIFSGDTNVALHRPIQSPAPLHPQQKRLSSSWAKSYLVDGSLPYQMDSSSGERSIDYLSSPIVKRNAAILKVDLEVPYPISGVHLHTIDGGDTVPHSNTDGVGTPSNFTIKGANESDFTDAKILIDHTKRPTSLDSPIMMWNIPETNCRYIRIIAPHKSNYSEGYQIGFAEIELIAKGKNVALGKSFTTNSTLTPASDVRSLEALTDGKNRFGDILPIRNWLEQLAERQLLETERPRILAELGQRYSKQKTILKIMTGMLGAAGVVICITILVSRNARVRQAAQIKERFAADLHDELGADLHTLRLLSELARNSVDSRDELIELLDEMQVMSERSGKAARYCTNMLEAEELCENLKDEIEKMSRRLLSDIHYELKIDGETELRSLRTQRRIDLYLFYKESLINIIRHSKATQVVIDISASKNRVQFIIKDNGIGTKQTPPSLARRARLLKAKIETATPDDGGTSTTLTLKRT